MSRPARLACLAALLGAGLAAGPGAGPTRAASDPTRPPGPRSVAPADEEAAGPSGPRLSSIVVSPARRVATIDGRAVREGDRVGAARVVAIELHSVRLRDARGEFTLRLSNPPVKRAAAGAPQVRAAPAATEAEE